MNLFNQVFLETIYHWLSMVRVGTKAIQSKTTAKQNTIQVTRSWNR